MFIATQLNSTSSWVELCRYRRVSIATQLNSTDAVEQRTAKSVVFLFMMSWPTNWGDLQLFTLWSHRQVTITRRRVELSCVAIDTSPTQLHSTSSYQYYQIYRQSSMIRLEYYYYKQKISSSEYNKNLTVANRACISCAHNTLRASIGLNITLWPWNLG